MSCFHYPLLTHQSKSITSWLFDDRLTERKIALGYDLLIHELVILTQIVDGKSIVQAIRT